jgi:uncharacterized iron-regulated protein
MKLTTLLSIRFPLGLALGLAAASASRAAEEPLDLSVGDPARRDRHVSVTLDAIVDTRTGDVLTPDELASRLEKTRLLLVGEGHTRIESHRVERRILEALVSTGRPVRVGLEMYPYTEQAWLDRWSKGQLTEDGFLALSRWYRNWGYNWGYYRDIFLFARDRGLPLAGVNAPRDVVSAVRKKGFTNLTPEEAAHVPVRVDTDSAEHRQLFKAFFGADAGLHASLTEEAFDGMFRAQCTWDATMAFNAANSLKTAPAAAVLVVFAGSGHVVYGLGIQRQAAAFFDGPVASLIPVEVPGEKGEAVSVRASFADYIWGVPREAAPLYPTLGLSTREGKEGEPLAVIDVEKDSVAAAAGVRTGDLLLAFDGIPVPDKEALATLLGAKRWGDRVTLDVRRGGQPVTLTARLRRTVPLPSKTPPSTSALRSPR